MRNPDSVHASSRESDVGESSSLGDILRQRTTVNNLAGQESHITDTRCMHPSHVN